MTQTNEAEILRLMSILEQEQGAYYEEIPTEQELASIALFLIGEPTVPYLIEALNSNNNGLVHWAVVTLKILEDSQAVEPLLNLIKDKDKSNRQGVRLNALWALAAINDKRAVEPLIELLEIEEHLNEYDVHDIINILGDLGDKRAVEPILKLLKDHPNDELKSTIIRVLGELGDSQAFDTLIKIVTNKDYEVHSQAFSTSDLDVLKKLKAYNLFLEALHDYHNAIGALGKLGDKRAYPILLDILEQKNLLQGIGIGQAALALADLKDRRAFEPLVKVMEIGVIRDAINIRLALGNLGDPRAFDILLADLDSGLSGAALGMLKDKRAFEPLMNLFNNHDLGYIYDALQGLGSLGDPRAVEPLLQALETNDDDAGVRFAICEALGMIGDERAIPKLKELALSDFESNGNQGGPNRVDEAAVEAIQKIRRKQKSDKV